MLSVKEARARILASCPELSSESVFLGDAVGRVLAEDLVSGRTLPPADNSAMDGYGVRAAETEGASEESPVTLTMAGAVLAGDRVNTLTPLPPGHAVRIMTGGYVPPGVDAIVMREYTDESEVRPDGTGVVRIKEAGRLGNHIRRGGEDIPLGGVVGRRGDVVTPARLNLIASAGHASVRVMRRPEVAILASGDELRELGTFAAPDDIINSNAHALAAMVRQAGGIPHLLGIAADTLDDHVKRIRAGGFADILVTIGGVSMGTHDYVRPAFEALGIAIDFWKVAQRPGKPLAFARRGEQLVFGVPGNPVSSQVTFELFIRPAMRAMMAMPDPVRKSVKATLIGEPYTKKLGFTFHARARARITDDGLAVEVLGKQSSGQISGLAEANALCVVPPDVERVEPGDRVDVLLLDDAVLFGRD